MSSKLNPCPFCKVEMSEYEDEEGMSENDFKHPANDCILSDFEFPYWQTKSWNRRADS